MRTISDVPTIRCRRKRGRIRLGKALHFHGFDSRCLQLALHILNDQVVVGFFLQIGKIRGPPRASTMLAAPAFTSSRCSIPMSNSEQLQSLLGNEMFISTPWAIEPQKPCKAGAMAIARLRSDQVREKYENYPLRVVLLTFITLSILGFIARKST